MTEKMRGKQRALDAAAIAFGLCAFLAVGMVVGTAWLVGRAVGWLP
jgi:hypothetical protein